MYYLRDRLDAITVFMPALVEELNYMRELIIEYARAPSAELAERMSVSTFDAGIKRRTSANKLKNQNKKS